MTTEVEGAVRTRGADAFRLDGKTAIITGAGRGMGRALALGFAKVGASIAVADINGDNAEEQAAALRDAGTKAVAVQVDHTDPAAVDRMVEATESELGPVDILVNNAGILSLDDFFEMSMEQWDRMIETNLRGPLLCMKRIVPGMVERGFGAIVNLGSSWSSRASVLNQSGGGPDYCVSKAAMQALTRAVAQAGAPAVRVNAIAPGVVDSPMTADLPLDTRLPFIPLARLQTVDDIVGAAVFLCSDAGNYITGQTLHINGGMLMID